MSPCRALLGLHHKVCSPKGAGSVQNLISLQHGFDDQARAQETGSSGRNNIAGWHAAHEYDPARPATYPLKRVAHDPPRGVNRSAAWDMSTKRQLVSSNLSPPPPNRHPTWAASRPRDRSYPRPIQTHSLRPCGVVRGLRLKNSSQMGWNVALDAGRLLPRPLYAHIPLDSPADNRSTGWF